MRETSVLAALVVDMVQYLEKRGHAARDVCRAAGIDERILASPDDRIPGSQAERLWQVSEQLTGDPLVGLHMAEQFNPGALDIMGYVLLSCRTVGEVLDRASRYASLLNDGMRITVVHDGAHVSVRCEILEGLDNYLLRDARHVVDSWWVGTARQLRVLPVEPVTAAEVCFRHAAPRDDSEYRRLLQAPVRFNARDDRFVLRRSDLERPIASANPALLQVFEQRAEQSLADLHGFGSVARRVSRVLAERLKGRTPSIGEVASALAMSARNLQRALQDEGTTFQALLDEVRSALARRFLADGANSVSQVAFLLGFSEPAAFHRAFRRWTGTTPAAARRGGAEPSTSPA